MKMENATNSYDIITRYIKTNAITVINQRFDLNSAYEELKHRLDTWTGEGSGRVIDRIEEIAIDISRNNPLAGSIYISLPSELNNSKKGLVNIKNKDDDALNGVILDFLILKINILKE